MTQSSRPLSGSVLWVFPLIPPTCEFEDGPDRGTHLLALSDNRHGRDSRRLQEALNGKPVDWIENVSDQQYQLGARS
jgi:hypothetical protein